MPAAVVAAVAAAMALLPVIEPSRESDGSRLGGTIGLVGMGAVLRERPLAAP